MSKKTFIIVIVVIAIGAVIVALAGLNIKNGVDQNQNAETGSSLDTVETPALNTNMENSKFPPSAGNAVNQTQKDSNADLQSELEGIDGSSIDAELKTIDADLNNL